MRVVRMYSLEGMTQGAVKHNQDAEVFVVRPEKPDEPILVLIVPMDDVPMLVEMLGSVEKYDSGVQEFVQETRAGEQYEWGLISPDDLIPEEWELSQAGKTEPIRTNITGSSAEMLALRDNLAKLIGL